jgi:hypothetical protein
MTPSLPQFQSKKRSERLSEFSLPILELDTTNIPFSFHPDTAILPPNLPAALIDGVLSVVASLHQLSALGNVVVYYSAEHAALAPAHSVVAVVTLSIILVRQRSEKRAQAEREAGYRSAVHAYSEVLKPGMTRKDVEEYRGARNLRFRHMCCVEMKNFPKGVYDDLTKVGQEDAPWMCSEKNVYVAFQFTGQPRNATEPEADASDRLRAITIYRWHEGCL